MSDADDTYGLDGDSIRKLREDHQRLASQFRNTQVSVHQLLSNYPTFKGPKILRVRNDSGMEIPPFGCMKIVNTFLLQGIVGVTVIQPDGALAVRYALNGPNPIANGGYGWAEMYGESNALNASLPPAAGQRYGPTANAWELTADAYPPIFTADGTAKGTIIFGKLETSLNLIWHVVIGTVSSGGIAPGGLTVIALPDGRTVSATNWTNTTFNTADRAECYQDQTNNTFYLGGGGSGSNPDQMAIVNVYSPTPTANSLWAGKIAVPNTSNNYSTNQFPNGADCWLTVLNQNLGSISTPKPDLNVGESFIGRHVGDYDNGDTTFTPIYAIYIGENEIYAVTIPSPGVGPGLTIAITLPDGRAITATNWSAVALSTDDLASVYHDKENKAWYLIKSGGAGVRRVQAQVNKTAGFFPADATVPVDTISTFDGSTAPTITTATNLLDLAGNNNDVVILEERVAAADWIVAEVASKFRRRVKAQVNATGGFYSQDVNVPVDTISTWDGSAAPAITTAKNPFDLSGNDNEALILEEVTSASPSTWFVVEVLRKFRRRVKAQVNNPAGFATTDANVAVDTVSTFDGSTAPTVTTAANLIGMSGNDNDVVILEEITSASPSTWFVADIRQSSKGQANRLEGYVYADFTKNTTAFMMVIQLAYDGTWPVDALNNPLVVVQVQNAASIASRAALTGSSYVFEGEAGSYCTAHWDEIAQVYRVDWVECPLNSPVGGSTSGGGSQNPQPSAVTAASGVGSGTGSYGYGGY